ncbi:MAG: type VI secretion system ATPase TssH, partial [Ruminococcus sp.]|nr:type VI secretion system ATPase TssH [Ruminococcus sp.]
MNAQKFTQKSLEAIGEAQSIAIRNSNQAVDEEHVMLALLQQESGLIPQLFVKMGADPKTAVSRFEQAVNAVPKVQVGGQSADSVYVSSELNKALAEAEQQAERMKDEYVSVEHIVLGILENQNNAVKSIFSELGITKPEFLKALREVRGNAQVTSQNPEETYDVLKKYGQELVELARNNKLDPVIGRDNEIRNVIRILSRKTKNNPVLIGEPGV